MAKSDEWVNRYLRRDSKELKTPEDKLRLALDVIGRTINVVATKTEGLQAIFPNKGVPDVNDPASKKVVLDPGPILNVNPKMTEGDKIDVLVGDALFASMSKETIEYGIWRKSIDTDVTNKTIAQLYRAGEYQGVYNAIEDKAPGFAEYLDARADYRNDEGYNEKLSQALAGKFHTKTAAALVAQSILDRGRHELPAEGKYQRARELGLDLLKGCKDSQERLAAAEKLYQTFSKWEEEEDEENREDSEKENGQGEEPDLGENGAEGDTGKLIDGEHQNTAQVSYRSPKPQNTKDKTGLLSSGPDERLKEVIAKKRQADINEYQRRISANRGQIEALKSMLSWRNDAIEQYERALTSGYLDDDSLYKAGLDEANPAIWERKEIINKPSIQVCLLLDESSSINSLNLTNPLIDTAVIITEALTGVEGVDLMAYAFGRALKEFIGPNTGGVENKESLVQLDPIGGTPLLMAARQAAVVMLNSVAPDGTDPARRLIFVLSDGKPNNPETTPAGIAEIRRKGVEVYGIGINNAYQQSTSDFLYGQGMGVVLPDVKSAVRIIGSFVARIMDRL